GSGSGQQGEAGPDGKRGVAHGGNLVGRKVREGGAPTVEHTCVRGPLQEDDPGAVFSPGQHPGLADSPGALFMSPRGLQAPSPEGERNKAPGESSSPGCSLARGARV